VILFAVCVTIAWASADNATMYEVRRDGAVLATVQDPTVIVCAPDFYTPHLFSVVGWDDSGHYGPTSDDLTLEWRWQLDLNGDGAVGFADFGGVMGRINAAWSTCHNGITEVDCE